MIPVFEPPIVVVRFPRLIAIAVLSDGALHPLFGRRVGIRLLLFRRGRWMKFIIAAIWIGWVLWLFLSKQFLFLILKFKSSFAVTESFGRERYFS